VTSGDALAQGYPMIAAVGQGATRERAPRLIELNWGKDGAPRIAIVGKGVCFDSGGLDIKPASGMRLMKKDMGGAAHALALGRLIMAERCRSGCICSSLPSKIAYRRHPIGLVTWSAAARG